MAAMAQHDAVFKMDATSGATALTDLSAGVISGSLNRGRNVGIHHTIGARDQKTTSGGNLTSLQLEVVVDITPSTALYDVLVDWFNEASPVDRTCEWYEPDAQTGSLKTSFEGTLAGFSPASQARGGSGDVKTASVTIQANGTVTFATVV